MAAEAYLSREGAWGMTPESLASMGAVWDQTRQAYRYIPGAQGAKDPGVQRDPPPDPPERETPDKQDFSAYSSSRGGGQTSYGGGYSSPSGDVGGRSSGEWNLNVEGFGGFGQSSEQAQQEQFESQALTGLRLTEPTGPGFLGGGPGAIRQGIGHRTPPNAATLLAGLRY